MTALSSCQFGPGQERQSLRNYIQRRRVNRNGTVFEFILPPTLNILLEGNQSVLFWPSSATNYVLQSTTNLASANWVAVSNAVPVIAVTVTNQMLGQFYRLINP